MGGNGVSVCPGCFLKSEARIEFSRSGSGIGEKVWSKLLVWPEEIVLNLGLRMPRRLGWGGPPQSTYIQRGREKRSQSIPYALLASGLYFFGPYAREPSLLAFLWAYSKCFRNESSMFNITPIFLMAFLEVEISMASVLCGADCRPAVARPLHSLPLSSFELPPRLLLLPPPPYIALARLQWLRALFVPSLCRTGVTNRSGSCPQNIHLYERL